MCISRDFIVIVCILNNKNYKLNYEIVRFDIIPTCTLKDHIGRIKLFKKNF